MLGVARALFLADHLHVVGVTFAESGARDLRQPGLGSEILEVGRSRITHAGAEAADELSDEFGQ